ncbi:MAG: hypothetical protein JST68_16910, partial [Bacteroidetes bacterium]|nr:hypothetical protein [Bacteroidota bacterium]
MKPGKFLIPVILVTLAALGCGKDGPGGKPVFKLTSIDKNPIKGNDSIVFHFTFENTSGKVPSGTFTSIRVR